MLGPVVVGYSVAADCGGVGAGEKVGAKVMGLVVDEDVEGTLEAGSRLSSVHKITRKQISKIIINTHKLNYTMNKYI